MTQPTLQELAPKKLIGIRQFVSIANGKTAELWRNFMPRKNEIHSAVGNDLISLQIYPEGYFQHFNPSTEFEKWALREVSDFNSIPEGMNSFDLPGGLYAVFNYKGLNTDTSIFQYIFSEWLPQSEFTLDHRPHFEVLGAKYKNYDPESEEEIWIPVRKKN